MRAVDKVYSERMIRKHIHVKGKALSLEGATIRHGELSHPEVERRLSVRKNADLEAGFRVCRKSRGS